MPRNQEMCTDLLASTLPPRKISGDLLKAARLVIGSNGVPFHQMSSIGSHSAS